jgi:sec-independent protein translocase protein TatC
MTLLDHLIEFRARLIKCLLAVGLAMIVSFIWAEPWIFRLAIAPLRGRELMYLGLGEAFSVHLMLAFQIGCILAAPMIAYQVWAFIAPGLYANERRIAVKLAGISLLLFAAGLAFGYYLILPVIVEFFLSFEVDGLQYGGAIEPYLRLVAGLLLSAGIVFQLPLLLLGLIKSGLVTRDSLVRQRRYWILGIVTVSAALTPTGDAATLALFSIPIWLLFELTLLLARLSAAPSR